MAGVSLQSPRAMPVRPSGGPTALLSAQHQGIQWGCQVQWQQEGSSQIPKEQLDPGGAGGVAVIPSSLVSLCRRAWADLQ